MKLLSRHEIDAILREVETRANGLALTIYKDSATTESALIDAFTQLAPLFPKSMSASDLLSRLEGAMRRRAGGRANAPVGTVIPVALEPGLHLRLVDLIEEHQQDEPPGGRRRLAVAGVFGVLVVGGLLAVQSVRWTALAASEPTITSRSPESGGKDAPTDGEIQVTFGRKPLGTPTLRLDPADTALKSPHWAGDTLVATYGGLHRATRYQLILGADYRSGLKDSGHLEKRWTFTVRGYPALTELTPAEGSTTVPRSGVLRLLFDERPSSQPSVTLEPAGSLMPGSWASTTWVVPYEGLEPSARYQVQVTVNQGAATANIRRRSSFRTEPGAPPIGTPVIWYSTSAPWIGDGAPQRLIALDWNGNLVGTTYQATAVQQNADGSLLIDQAGTYREPGGRVLLGASTSGRPAPLLAAEGHDLCDLQTADGRAIQAIGQQVWLFAGPLGGQLRRLANVGVTGSRSTPVLVACSLLHDRVVISDSGVTGTYGIRVMTLSGRVLYRRAYSGSPISFVVSPDGRYLAEQTPSFAADNTPTGGTTVIRRIGDGVVVGQLVGRRVVRFTSDGVRAIVTPFWGVRVAPDVELLEWQTGKVLWRLPAPPGTEESRSVYALAEPNGTGIVVAVGEPQSSGYVDGLWLVHADGTAARIVTEAVYPAFSA